MNTKTESSPVAGTATRVGYVDGFVIPLPLANLEAYRQQATLAAAVWREYGALDYVETIGEDLNQDFGTPFGNLAKTNADETVVFAWISYRDRAHRDEVNAKVMADPRIQEMCPDHNPDFRAPFDPQRMTYGGFEVLVQG